VLIVRPVVKNPRQQLMWGWFYALFAPVLIPLLLPGQFQDGFAFSGWRILDWLCQENISVRLATVVSFVSENVVGESVFRLDCLYWRP
jgi:hypothetical protein